MGAGTPEHVLGKEGVGIKDAYPEKSNRYNCYTLGIQFDCRIHGDKLIKIHGDRERA